MAKNKKETPIEENLEPVASEEIQPEEASTAKDGYIEIDANELINSEEVEESIDEVSNTDSEEQEEKEEEILEYELGREVENYTLDDMAMPNRRSIRQDTMQSILDSDLPEEMKETFLGNIEGKKEMVLEEARRYKDFKETVVKKRRKKAKLAKKARQAQRNRLKQKVR